MAGTDKKPYEELIKDLNKAQTLSSADAKQDNAQASSSADVWEKITASLEAIAEVLEGWGRAIGDLEKPPDKITLNDNDGGSQYK